MNGERFQDPVLELVYELGGDPADVLGFADVSDAEAEVVLGVLAEVNAEMEASGVARRLRAMGHTL
jgi:hypothetical protein